MPEELIQKIEFLLINEGQKDQRLKWGEWIKYTPCQVGDMLRKHADEFSEFQFGAAGDVNNKNTSTSIRGINQPDGSTLYIDLNRVSYVERKDDTYCVHYDGCNGSMFYLDEEDGEALVDDWADYCDRM